MARMSDTPEDDDNIRPLRPLDEDAAIAWLRSQPGGRTKLSDAELGRRWGWKRQRVGRRIKAWAKDGRITRRGNTITYVGAGPATQVDLVPPAVPSVVPPRPVVDVPSPPVDAPPIMPTPVGIVAPSERSSRIRLATLAAALSLASVSAYFSITGMTAIFVGALYPVRAMGIALEVGKLAAVAWLGHQHGMASWRLRAALTILVAVLMTLNAVGAYGFLAKAHIGHQVEGDVAVAGRNADVEARLSMQAGVVADIDRRIAQIDGAIETATQRGRSNAAMQLAADQRRTRSDLAAERAREGKALAALQVEKAVIEGQRKIAEADLGPVRYLATLLGAGDQDVLRWFILVVAFLLDPAAVLLLLAATRR